MESATKKKNIVNNLRWLMNDISSKTSNACRLWLGTAADLRQKLILGSRYLGMVEKYNTLQDGFIDLTLIALPEFDYSVDTVTIRLDAESYTYAPNINPLSSNAQVLIYLWETIAATTAFQIAIDKEENILYLYNFDNTLDSSTITLELNGDPQSTITVTTDTAVEIVEKWNELTVLEINDILKTVVKLQAVKPKYKTL